VTSCLDVLDAANYFGIDTLKHLCIDHSYSALTVNNYFYVVSFAHTKKLSGFPSKMSIFSMFLYAVDLIKSPQIKDLPIEVLLAFFDGSDVRAKEMELFTTAIE